MIKNQEVIKILIFLFIGFISGWSFKTCGIDHDEGEITYPEFDLSKRKWYKKHQDKIIEELKK